MTPGVPVPSKSATKVELRAGTPLQGAHDGPADDVGEADLATGRACQLVVDFDLAVDLEQLGGHGTDINRSNLWIFHKTGRRVARRCLSQYGRRINVL